MRPITPVAPRAGAWVETLAADIMIIIGNASHPVRVRGLKLCPRRSRVKPVASHPVRVRGLKPPASVTGVVMVWSHPVRVRGLKRQGMGCSASRCSSRTPCGCVG